MKNFKFKWLLLSFILSIASINTAWGHEREYDGTEKLYFKNFIPSGWGATPWISSDKPHCWVHLYNGSFTKDVKLTLHSGTANTAGAIYVCTPPEGNYTNVILVRTNNSTSIEWPGGDNQSKDIYVGEDDSKNMIDNLSPGTWGTNYGGWTKYAPTPAVIGSMNGWKVEKNPTTGERWTTDGQHQNVKIMSVELAASTDYTFRIIDGQSQYGKSSLTITGATKDGVWEGYSTGDGKDVTITSGEAGTYYFQYNASSHYVAVYYPKAILAKNKVYYFDASNADKSYWDKDKFSSMFWFRYYDSHSNVKINDVTVDGAICYAVDTLPGPIYYQTAPDVDLIGEFVIDRYNEAGNEYWNTSGYAPGTSRSSSYENCASIINGDSWTPNLGNWRTYCPPMSVASLSDNSTSKISWKNGSGTSEDPYLVPATGTIKVSASATSAVPADDNMTINYDFKVNTGSGASSAQSSSTSTFDKGSLTNNTTYEISLDAWNSYNGATGTKKTDAPHIWYKALNMYSVNTSLTNMSVKDGERTGSNAAAYQIAYSVVLNANTGYNRPASVTVMRGSTNITANCTWTQGTGTLSIPAAQVTGNITITAAGVAKTYDITLDDNGDYNGNGSATATYYTTTLTEISAPNRTGYHVTGYYTNDATPLYIADASGTLQASKSGYTDGSSRWTKDDVATLYAHWEANTHSLSWNANGGDELTGSYTSGTTAYGTTIVKPNTPTQSGYVFKGWAESADGDVVDVPATMPDADKSYYAQWLNINDVANTCWDGDTYKCTEITNLATPKQAATAAWSTADWGGGTPTLAKDVVIPANMAMTVDVNHAQAKSIQLTGTATLKIDADAGLVVEEGITKDGNATTSSDLDILSTDAGTGALITAQKSTNTQAGVQFYTKARRVGDGAGTWVNQYFGIPLAGMNAYDAYYDTYIYVFDVATDAWQPLGNNAAMTPFTAYNIMRDESEATTLGMAGTLNLPGIAAENKDKVLNMTRFQTDIDADKSTENMFANSWTAPIAVGEIKTTDFVGAEATIYIFNAGTRNEQQNHKDDMSSKKHTTAGQWYYMPVAAVKASSEDFTLTTIPSQQAFLVMATGEAAATHKLTLDYKNVVYDPAVTSGATIDPLRAPKRVAEDKATVLNVYVEGTESANADELLLFEREDFSTGYDNGWEAKKLSGASFTPQLYSLSEDGNKAIDAVPDVEGTILGFKAGSEDNQYTFSFKYDSEAEPLYLYDMDTKVYTRVDENSTYTFNTNDKETHNRFALIRRAPQIVTGVEDVTSDGLKGSKTTKFIENGQLYILRDGRIYNAEGSLVK